MWTCQTCGERHDDEFDSCWKCALPSLPIDCTAVEGADSLWWLVAVISPIAFAVLDFLIGTAGLVLTAGCVISVVCREASGREREKLYVLSGLGAWPSIVWLALRLVMVIGSRVFSKE